MNQVAEFQSWTRESRARVIQADPDETEPLLCLTCWTSRVATEAWCSGDPTRVAEHYAPDGSLTINGGSPAIGRVAITEAARGFMDGFPDLRVEMDELRTGGDSPEYHWTLTGTNTGPGGTGNAVRISGFEQWTIGDHSLIAASLGSYDAADWDRQINGAPDS